MNTRARLIAALAASLLGVASTGLSMDAFAAVTHTRNYLMRAAAPALCALPPGAAALT